MGWDDKDGTDDVQDAADLKARVIEHGQLRRGGER